MFHFKLRDIEQIQPWGPLPHLGYFGLTDGCYWIRVGEEELFRYTPEILACWREESQSRGIAEDEFCGPYDRYQVMRLFEDLDDVLPYAMEEVPQEIAEYVDVVNGRRESSGLGPVPTEILRSFARREGREIGGEEELLYSATEWWGNRQMRVMHLRYSPRIHMWNDGGKIEIRWDNRHHRHEGIQVWTADFGKFRISRTNFEQAVATFWQALVKEMGERVERICASWSRPEVKIDLNALIENQRVMEERVARWDHHFVATTEWAKVLRTLRGIAGDEREGTGI